MSFTSPIEHNYCKHANLENNSSSTSAAKAYSRKRTYAEVASCNVTSTEHNYCKQPYITNRCRSKETGSNTTNHKKPTYAEATRLNTCHSKAKTTQMDNCVLLHHASQTGIVNGCVTNTSKQPIVTNVTWKNKHLNQTPKHMKINKSIVANEAISFNNNLTKRMPNNTDTSATCNFSSKKINPTQIPVQLYNLDSLKMPANSVFIEGKVFNNFHVPGDGNCFFSCLSLALHNNTSMSTYYRNMICTHVIENWNSLQQSAICGHELVNKSVEEYRLQMITRCGWATISEITAACDILPINIEIWLKGRICNSETRQTLDVYTRNSHSSPHNSDLIVTLLLWNSPFTL